MPFRDITNCALKSETFPEAYKISEIVAIPKVLPPRELKDLRPISKTPVGGKILEKMILTDLEYDIKSSPSDVSQFGNTKGCSTTHYLIKATNEAFKSTDNGGAISEPSKTRWYSTNPSAILSRLTSQKRTLYPKTCF